MRKLILLAGLLTAMPPGTHGQSPGDRPVFFDPGDDVLVAERVNHFTRVEAPPRSPGSMLRPGVTAEFSITISGNVPEGTAAIEAAAAIWSTHISSTVPIRVQVNWVEMEENVLGAAAPVLAANFPAAFAPNTFYPTALANALTGHDLFPQHSDITVHLNSVFQTWYFGTDGNPPEDTFDLMTVVLHEIGHGLGFIGSMRVTNDVATCGTGDQGYPIIYDRFVETDLEGTTPLLVNGACPSPSVFLAEALQSEELFFNSPTSVAANIDSQLQEGLPVPPGGRPKLHAPDNWVPGSSYNHLTEEQIDDEEVYYPPGSINSLMTSRLGATEVIRTPGPVVCGMFRDMGWPLGSDCEALLPEDQPPPEDPLLVVGPCPNPAVGGLARIQIYVDEQTRVRADLYDVLGRRVRRVVDDQFFPEGPTLVDGDPRCVPGAAGARTVDLSGLASGIYLLRVFTANAQQTVKVINVH